MKNPFGAFILLRGIAAILFVVSFGSGVVSAQEWWTDMRVRSIRASQTADRFTCSVEISNDGGDGGWNTNVQILLPAGVRITSPGGCTPGMTRHSSEGRASCELGLINVDERRTVEVVTTAPPARVSRTCAAFVASDTPDLRPRNNYGEATATLVLPGPRAELGPLAAEITGYAPAGCLRKGSAVTINGFGFGETQGTKTAELAGHDIGVTLPISRWSSRSIAATIPNDPQIRVGQSYYIGIKNREGNWISNINRRFTICK